MRRLLPALAALCTFGCVGVISTPDGTTETNGPTTETTSDACKAIAPPSPLRRLTREQYNRTIQDLLRVDDKPASDFVEDDVISGFDVAGNVAPLLAEQHVAAAEKLAAKVDLAKIAPEAAFVPTFLRRAFRRPPSADDLSRYNALLATGATFADGARLVIEAALLSPRFLDTVKGDFASMRKELPAAQLARLDAHLESIRAIEKRLLEAPSSACVKPTLGSASAKNGWDEYDNMPRIAELQMDIMATAFACDLTRVGTIAFNWAASNARFPFLGINEWHHELSHAPAADLVARAKRIKIERWFSEQLKSFMDRLAAIKEGDGTVLDHTLIVCVNELAESFYHTHQNMPFMLAGGASGALRMGRYLKFADKPHNDLLVSICNAMGLPDTTFGDPAACTGPLPGLV